MARSHNLGKSIVLLLLIIILVLGGLMWFDYLGVIKAKKLFAPAYKMLHLEPQTSETATQGKPLTADLTADRLAKGMEQVELRRQELDKRESDIARAESQNEEIARELEDRKKSQDEREKAFVATQKQYNDRAANILQVTQYLANMPPATAVAQLLEMDDQDIIDIFRKEDELAAAARTASMTSVWLMNMPADRAAVINRKMTNKPETLD